MDTNERIIRIGAGAGYAGDRIDPAVELAEKGRLDYLVFECLAERTVALAHLEKQRNPSRGYDPLLEARCRAVLGPCREGNVRVITNAGAANPIAAAHLVVEVARSLGLRGLTVAAVTGDDVLDRLGVASERVLETGLRVSELDPRPVSANAYLGAAPIVEALRLGADVVITGRAADPSLFLAPLIHEHEWAEDDWTLLGRGTVVGHLLECAGQVSGGYFADPGLKDVPDLARLGFPIAEVSADGTATITKVEGSGGRVSLRTCKEQLLYEIHDPAAYLTPDVVADFSGVSFADAGPDRVRVEGGDGRQRPDALKVSLGIPEGFIGEGEISYAGPGAVNRARLALEIIDQRLRGGGALYADLRTDLIGVDALHGKRGRLFDGVPYEVRARVAARTLDRSDAERIGREVEALYTNGPAAGGGVTKRVREVMGVVSCLIPRGAVRPVIYSLEA